jgi:serine/threonine protein kinase
MVLHTAFALPDRRSGYSAGEVLRGEYELVRPIGRTTWVVRDLRREVHAVLKLGLPFVDAGRSLDEARLTAPLVHPAVCRLLDFGLSDRGHPFVVSELLRGETLGHVLLRQSRLPPATAVRIVLPVLDGLSAAHKLGVVHRAVKPAKIFLARQSGGRLQPKLVGFGGPSPASGELHGAPELELGADGRPPPARARGSLEIDARGDLWSLCASLYELVGGRAAEDGDDIAAVRRAVLTTQPPSPSRLVPDLGFLAEIVERGLDRALAERHLAARALGSDLARWLMSRGVKSDICGHSLYERVEAASTARRAGSAADRRPGYTTTDRRA